MERRGGCEDDAGAWAQSSGPVYELAADMVEREVEGPPGVEPGFAKLIEVELASELDRGEPEGGTVGGRSGARVELDRRVEGVERREKLRRFRC